MISIGNRIFIVEQTFAGESPSAIHAPPLFTKEGKDYMLTMQILL